VEYAIPSQKNQTLSDGAMDAINRVMAFLFSTASASKLLSWKTRPRDWMRELNRTRRFAAHSDPTISVENRRQPPNCKCSSFGHPVSTFANED
jgi:hypothetical protein